MLIEALHSSLQSGWRLAFSQARTHRRAMEHALALPCALGRRTISRTLCVLGRSDHDWSADYKMFSRSRWEPDRLFDPVIDEYLERYGQGPVVAAIDDTKLRKSGRQIKSAAWQRDPLSPPFRVNLLYGLRFVQISLLFPHYREGDYPPRSIPVRFQEAPPLKKPGRRASAEEVAQYRRLKKGENLSTQSLRVMRSLRASLDQRGGAGRALLLAADGSFCNQTIFKARMERTEVIARCRKDARLCFPAVARQRRKYDQQIFTPEQVRQQAEVPYQRAYVYLGGKQRMVRYKEIAGILWRRGAGTRKLRLLVVAPVPYKLSPRSRTLYRQPAFLLTTDLLTSPRLLLSAYFDRWQIEVNHRDEKDILGVGQAQVRHFQSVPRHPALTVASYSMLLLAALRDYGPGRTKDYVPLPRWRKGAKRASFLDIVTLLRQQTNETSVSHLINHEFQKNLMLYADT
jgi:hypothetical protein